MNTDWLYQSKFGLFVHWTTFTLYKDDKEVMTADFNKRLSLYKEAVDNFPVKEFAKRINSFGARFVIFVTSHADMVLPFPLKELDEIIPNCTCKRDLVRELIDELKKYNIKLLLYFNGDGFNNPEWQKVSKWYDNPKQHAEYCYKITKAISDRYKDDIAGWWIDGCYLIDYNNRCGERYDFKKYKECLTSGNKDAIVAFNINGAEPWTFKLENISDYQAGELYCLDDRLPNGRFSGEGGSQWFSCCLMDDLWVHDKPGEIKSKYDDKEVIEYLRKVFDNGGVFAYNCALYKDGSFPDCEIKQLANIKKEFLL